MTIYIVISTIFYMQNLKTFEDENGLIQRMQEPLYNTVLHYDKDVYFPSTMALFVADGECKCIKLTNAKQAFSSFVCNGVEMITEDSNAPQTYGLLQENPITICNNTEIKTEIKKNVTYEIENTASQINIPLEIVNVSFGRQLTDGESIYIRFVEDVNSEIIYEKVEHVFVYNTELFNKYFTWNDTASSYEFNAPLYYSDLKDGVLPRIIQFIGVIIYGCTNSSGIMTSEDDFIPTIETHYGWQEDENGNSVKVPVDTVVNYISKPIYNDIITYDEMYELDLDYETIDFGRLIEDDDFIYYCKYDSLYHIFGSINPIPSSEFLTVAKLVSGTTYMIDHNTMTYAGNLSNSVGIIYFLSKNDESLFNPMVETTTFTHAIGEYSPFPKGKEFKCSFKFIDDEINDCDIFYGCYNLKSIDLSSYQGLKIVDRYQHGIHDMFYNTSMENIKLCPIECVGEQCDYTNFLYSMFNSNPFLSYVDLTPLTSNGAEQYKTIDYLFNYCTNLKCVKMSGDFSNVIHYEKMFNGVETEGTLFYDKRYDYSKIIEQLPEKWEAIGLDY